MSSSKGVSLLELLVALATGAIVASMLLSLLTTLQQGQEAMDQRLGRLENLRTVPLLLVRLTAAAGNREWAASWRGLDASTTTLRARADIDGPEGFPDGELSSSFESLALRGQADQIQVKSGRANFQPLVTGIAGFSWLRLTDERLVFQIEHAPNTSVPDRRVYEVEVFLWNAADNLFLEER